MLALHFPRSSSGTRAKAPAATRGLPDPEERRAQAGLEATPALTVLLRRTPPPLASITAAREAPEPSARRPWPAAPPLGRKARKVFPARKDLRASRARLQAKAIRATQA